MQLTEKDHFDEWIITQPYFIHFETFFWSNLTPIEIRFNNRYLVLNALCQDTQNLFSGGIFWLPFFWNDQVLLPLVNFLLIKVEILNPAENLQQKWKGSHRKINYITQVEDAGAFKPREKEYGDWRQKQGHDLIWHFYCGAEVGLRLYTGVKDNTSS